MGATSVGNLYGAILQPDGVFYALSSTRIADVIDGVSNTIFIVETRETGAAVWIDGGTAAVASRRYLDSNAPSYAGPENSLNFEPYYVANGQGIDAFFGPSSMHVGGGINHLLGDGSVRSISPNINALVYDSLVTRSGGEPIGDFNPGGVPRRATAGVGHDRVSEEFLDLRDDRPQGDTKPGPEVEAGDLGGNGGHRRLQKSF